jgi:hypothetical protein
MGIRRRCTECRHSFTPSPRARDTQLVCGAACRAARDRKLARARRRDDLDAYHKDERDRQRAARARRAAAAAAPTGASPRCHAPPSAPRSPDLQDKVLLIVARLFEASRATFQREMRRRAASPRSILAEPRRLSRASFERQACDPTAQSGAISAACHAP